MRRLILIGLACLVVLSIQFMPRSVDSAATVTWTALKTYDPEDMLYRAAITFDASYPPYGETIDARSYMTEINYAIVECAGDGGYIITINDSLYSTGYLKVQVWWIEDTGTADSTVVSEIPSASDISAQTGVTLLISGKQ